MTVCKIILSVVSCVVDPSHAITASEAAALVAPRQFVWAAPIAKQVQELVRMTPERRSADQLPARRLDGSLLSDPPTVYIGYLPRRQTSHRRQR